MIRRIFRHRLGPQLLTICSMLLGTGGSAFAQTTISWNGAGSDQWGSATNWSTFAVPNLTNAVVFNSGTLRFNVSLGGTNRTVSSLKFDSTTAFTLSDDTAWLAPGDVTVTKGTGHVISADISLLAGSKPDYDIASGAALTLSGVLFSTGSTTTGLAKLGSGTLILGGTNTFQGTTTISAGTVRLDNAYALQNSTVSVQVDGGLTFDEDIYEFYLGGLSGNGDIDLGYGNVFIGSNNASTSYSGELIGAGSITKEGSGTLTLTRGSLGLGDLYFEIDEGDVVFDEAYGELHIIRGASGTSQRVTFRNDTDIVFDDSLTGVDVVVTGASTDISVPFMNDLEGLLVEDGAVLTVSTLGSNDGSLIVDGASLIVKGLFTPDYAVDFLISDPSDGAALTFDLSSDASLAAKIDDYEGSYGIGSGSIVKTGAGTLSLGGTSSFTGTTSILEGALHLTTALALRNSTVELAVDGGLTFSDGTGTYLIGGLAGSGDLDFGTRKLRVGNNDESTTYTGDITGSGTFYKEGSGNLVLRGDSFDLGAVDQSGGGSLVFDGAAGTLASLAGDSSSPTIFQNGADFQIEGLISYADLTVTGSGTTVTTGGLNALSSLQVADGAQLDSSEFHSGGSLTTIVDGGSLILQKITNSTTSDRFYLSDPAGGIALTFDLADNATLYGVISDYAGTYGTGMGSIEKTGAGTLELRGNSTYTGTTVISQGTLQIGTGDTVGSIVSDVANAGTLVFKRSDALTYGGVISGTGDLKQIGLGALTLSGANTFTGATTISAGQIVLGNALALQNSTVSIDVDDGLDLNGFDATLGGLAGSGNLALGSQALTVGGNGDSTTYAGILSGTGSLTKTGVGTLILTGDNTATGTTTISSGTLQLGAGDTSGTVAGNIVNNGSLTIDRSDDFTLSGLISGTGSLTHAGAGTLTLTGDNTTTGTTTISTGTLQLGDGGTTGIVAGDIVNNGTLTIDRTDDFTFSGLISGTGDLAKLGTGGDLTLGAANTFTGTTTIEEGRIFLGNALALQNSTVELSRDYSLGLNGNSATLGALSGTGAIYVSGTQTLTVGGNGTDTTYSGSIQGDGGANFKKEGAGTLVLTGTNTHTGTTTINAGSIILGTGSALKNSTVSIGVANGLNLNSLDTTLGGLAGSGALALGSSNLSVGGNHASTTYSGVLSGTGDFTKTGSGTLTLSAANTFSGTTTISAGQLALGHALALQNSTVSIGVDDGLALNSFDATLGGLSGTGALNAGTQSLTVGGNGADTTYAGVLSGSGSLTKAGTGALTLTGASTFSGDLAIAAGSLVIDRDDDFSYGGTISGSGSLTKTGIGTLTLSGDNPFTGDTTINAGAINLATGDYLNTSLQNSTVEVNVDGGLTLAGAEAARIGALRGSGNVDLADNAFELFVGSNDASTTYSGNFSNATNALIYKEGDGTWTLTGTDLAFHELDVDAGALVFDGAAGTLGRIASDSNQAITFQNGTQLSVTAGIDGGALTVTGAGTDLSVSNSLSSYASLLVQDGANLTAGTLTFDATTPVIVNAATLTITALGGSQAGSSLQIADPDGGTALTFDLATSGTYDGTIADYNGGTGSVLKTGAGTLTLSGDNTFTGTTTINAGAINLATADYLNTSLQNSTVEVNVDGGLTLAGTEAARIGALRGNGNVDLADNAFELFVGSNDASTTFSGDFSNATNALIYKEGDGTWTLTGTGLAFHELDVNAGALVFDAAAGTLGRIASDSNQAITFQNGTQLSVTAGIEGGALTVTGAGTDLSVSNSLSSYTSLLVQDGANLTAGTLTFDATTPVIVNAATLTITALGGSQAGSSLQIADPDGGTALTFDLATSGSYDGTITDYNGGTGSVLKTGVGTLTLSGTNTYSGDTTINAGGLYLDGSAADLPNSTVVINADGGLVLNHASYYDYVLGGLAGSGDFDASSMALHLGGNNASTTYSGNYTGGGALFKDGSGTWTLTGDALDLPVIDQSGGAMIFDGAGGRIEAYNGSAGTTLTFQNGAVIEATSRIAIADLTVTGAGTTLTADQLEDLIGLRVADGGQLTADTFSGEGHATYIVDQGSLTLNQILYAPSTDSFQLSDPTGGTALTLNLATDATFDSTISDYTSGPGSVLKTGAGTLTLTAANTYTGGTTISAGTLQLGDGGTTGIVAGDIVNHGTLTFNRTDDFTFSGLISGTGDLAKLGTDGDLTLSAANTFSGTTTIEEGRILLGNALALQNSTVELSRDYSLSLNGNSATLGALSGSGAIYVSGTQTLTVGGNGTDTTYSGSIQGDGGANLQKEGAGTLVLSGTNTYTGTTTINAGSIILGTGNALKNSTVSIGVADGLNLNGFDTTLGGLAGSGDLALGSQTLSVGRNNAATTYSGILSGTGSLTKEGTGTLTLTGDNTYSGGTTISAGTLQLGAGSGSGWLDGNVANEATLTFNRSDDVSFGGDISGTGGVTQAGPGDLRLTGNLTYTGATTISGGTLILNSATQFQSSTVSIGVADGLDLNGFDATVGGLSGTGNLALGAQTLTVGGNGENTTYSGTFSGTGNLIKEGSGILTFDRLKANAVTGLISVNEGELWLNSFIQGDAIPGDLTVGDSIGDAESAVVRITDQHLMGSSSTLRVLSDGLLSVDGYSERVGAVEIMGGRIDTGTTKGLATLEGLTMTGGLIDGSAVFYNFNNITVRASSEQAVISSPVRLAGGLVNITVEDGTQENDLLISGKVSYRGITKEGSGTLALTNLENDYPDGTVINAGTIAATGGSALGTGAITFDGGTLALGSATSLTQNVTVNAGGGTLSASDKFTLSGDLTNDGTLTAANGLLLSGTVNGNGTFSGAVTVSGTLAPGHSPGTMNFTDLTLTSAALVQIELAGYTQGTDYDYLNISGTATLDGTLELSFLNDFAPQVGDTFSIASWTSHSGEFTSIGGTYPTGYTFSATYSDTGLTLTTLSTSAVPEPGTYALFAGLSILGFATWRRSTRKCLVRVD